MPFNWRTPFGYLITISLQYILAQYSIAFICPVLCFFIGSCFLLKSFAGNITNDINSLNAVAKKKSDRNYAKKIRTIFCNAVQDHGELQQLSTILAHVFFLRQRS